MTIDIQDHAKQWATSITTDTEATLGLFADEFVYDDRRDIDHVVDTPIVKDDLRDRLTPFANTDKDNGLGIHQFDVREAIATTGSNGALAVAILWDWTGEHLANFRGVPTDGRKLTARGQTWHQFDADGNVTRESTYWNDAPVFVELGLPLIIPEYWVEGFDFASLG